MAINLVVAVTDDDWFEMLRRRPNLTEVNFWAPSAANFRALKPGELFLFKLHAPRNLIVGGGIFAYATTLPCSLAWAKVFHARAGGPTVNPSAFTALRAERLPLSDAEVEAEIERLKALPEAEYQAEREPAASRLGMRLSVLDRFRFDDAKEEVGRAIPQQAAAVTAAPPAAVMSRAERKAIKEASLKDAEERYFQLIEGQPDKAPEARATLEKKMMDEFKVTRDEARYCRAKAIKRYRSLHPDNPCRWSEAGR
jgi:hypothetical protein